MMFADRVEAGRRLAEELAEHRGDAQAIVLGIPRGGVIVAAEVAGALGVPLDVLVVRKVGHPANPEYAAGAVDPDGSVILNPQAHVTEAQIATLAEEERVEAVRRLRLYREGREELRLEGRNAILVDDGIATGLTALKAVGYAKRHGAGRVIMAAPVMAPEAAAALGREADKVVAVEIRTDFAAVGQFYRYFPQTTDDEVRDALAAFAEMHR